MPAGVVLSPIYDALKALMAAYGPLTALIRTKAVGGAPAIYDEGGVPQSSAMPYLTIGAGTQHRSNRFGAATGAANTPTYGWNCTLQIKAVGQGTESVGLAIMHQVGTVLAEGTPLTLAGYESAWVDEFEMQPTIITTLAGIVTREWPAILRVRAYD
jgi:hypothetical protein